MLLPASLLFSTLRQTSGALTAFAIASGCVLVSAGLLVFWVNSASHRAN